jgi:thiol-disulfide isomerase/thioredoxin
VQPAYAEEVASLKDGLAQPYPAPAIVGIDQWFNSAPLNISDLKGKVVLVDFWTYSCINCVRTLSTITAWDEKYRDAGLVIIGIHTPEFEFEKNPDNVKASLAAHTIRYPVALDSHSSTWESFNNHYWPAHYLIDKQGNVVYTHFGEGDYDITENNIRALLGLKAEAAVSQSEPQNKAETPETYLGYARAQHFATKMPHDIDVIYVPPETLPYNAWSLFGKWNVGAENITAKGKGAAITLHFTAKKVFLVLGNTDAPVHLSIKLNGKPQKGITVDHHSLYQVASQDTSKSGMLEITADNTGLEAYAFTFGE